MAKYLLDSSTVIDILRKNISVRQNMYNAFALGDILSICPVVYYEVVRGFKGDTNTNKYKVFLQLYQSWQILPFDIKAADKAVEIYVQLHKGQVIEDNDIYIAAVAMANDCTLVTANTKHFGRIENLKIVNWRE